MLSSIDKKNTMTQPTWQQLMLSKLPQTLLIGIIVGTALAIPFAVHLYREDFKHFDQLKKEEKRLNVVWGQLIIEQQTFGATTNIGLRAMDALNMISPDVNNTIYIQPHQTPHNVPTPHHEATSAVTNEQP